MKLQNHAYPRRFAVLGAVFAAALFGSVLLGRFSVTPKELFRLLLSRLTEMEPGWRDGAENVVFQIRLPRVAAAALIGAALAALVGMLGSFITGSNMSSNILFGSFQMTTAELVGLQPAPILAAQTVGGSAGSLISPSKIVLGATTAGHPEMVGAIIRKLLPVALLFSLTSGAVVLLSGLMLG